MYVLLIQTKVIYILVAEVLVYITATSGVQHLLLSDAYLKPSQTSKMERFATIVFWVLATILPKLAIIFLAM